MNADLRSSAREVSYSLRELLGQSELADEVDKLGAALEAAEQRADNAEGWVSDGLRRTDERVATIQDLRGALAAVHRTGQKVLDSYADSDGHWVDVRVFHSDWEAFRAALARLDQRETE